MKRHSAEIKRWRTNHPEKLRAHTAVNNAVRSGRLIPQSCARCGNANTQAHHEDYTKPLQVVWLCFQCHVGEHHPNRKPKTKTPTAYPWHKRYQPAPRRFALQGKAIALRSQGMSYQKIANALGVNIGQVYKWINPKPDYS